jgi:hypothetical protein
MQDCFRRLPRVPLLVVLAALLVGPGSTGARACDSSACLLVTRGQNGVLARGAWRLDVSWRRVSQTVALDGSRETDRVLRPKIDFTTRQVSPGFHLDQAGREHYLQVEAAYGLTSRSTLLASFPLFARRSYEIVHPPFFERYTTEGNGDLLVGVRHALGKPARPVVVGLSLKAPTGRYRLESANRGDFGILDPTLQPGSGSFDAVASVQYGRRLAGLDWTVSGSWQWTTENSLGYRFGNETIASVSAGRSIGGPVTGSLQVKAFHKGRSRYLGGDVPSTGTTVVYATPGLRVSAPARTSVYAFLQIPVYRYVNETQLAPRPGILVGVSRTF